MPALDTGVHGDGPGLVIYRRAFPLALLRRIFRFARVPAVLPVPVSIVWQVGVSVTEIR